MRPERLEALYREHSNDVARAVGHILGDPSLATDCVHDVCLRLLNYERPVAYERQLLRVASVNRARDVMRGRCSSWDNRAVNVDYAENIAEEGVEPDMLFEIAEQSELVQAAVRDAIALLPLIQADAVWRHHAEGQSVPVIARETGVPESTIKMRLMRARESLRRVLASDPRLSDHPATRSSKR